MQNVLTEPLPLAAIFWTNAAMLAGLAAVTVPLIVHLLTHRTPRELVFPTIRFLRAASASQSRLYRWRHWLLLLLRSAIVALLVLAFARPVWHRTAEAATNADRDTVAIVLLDASASMGYRSGPQTRFQAALARTETVLDQLDAQRGDQANVILAAAAPQPLLAKPTLSIPLLKHRLADATFTQETADLNAACQAAIAQLADYPTSRKELHIISDYQQTTWRDGLLGAVPNDVHLFLHELPIETDAPNAAIEAVETDPPRPVVGQPCRIRVRVVNHGPARIDRRVRLMVNNEPLPQTQPVTIGPGEAATATFALAFQHDGVIMLSASMEPDGLAVDDTRYAVVDVRQRLPVLLCTDADLSTGATGSYFLTRALLPQKDAAQAIKLSVIPSAELTAAQLVGIDVLLIDDVHRFGPTAVSAIQEFLARGGAATIFLGPGPVRENLTLLGQTGPAAAFAEHMILQSRNDEPARLDVAPIEVQPLLRAFTGSPMRSLQNVNVYRWYGATHNEDMTVLARLSTADAAITTAPFGQGTLMLCTISPDPAWSDLAKHAAFPALAHEIVRYLRPTERRPDVYAGASTTMQWRIDDPFGSLQAVGPDDKPIRISVRRNGPEALVHLRELPKVGLYRVYQNDQLLASVAVNIDPAESDLAALTPKAIQDLAHNRQTAVAVADAAAAAAQRRGTPLWPWLIAAALIVMASEMVCTRITDVGLRRRANET